MYTYLIYYLYIGSLQGDCWCNHNKGWMNYRSSQLVASPCNKKKSLSVKFFVSALVTKRPVSARMYFSWHLAR
jgi:hypothetical protein